MADISWCIEQTKQLYESDCKVINNSFGFSLESENSYSNSDIKKFLKSLDDYSGANLKSYNEYLQCIENVAEANGIHLGLMIAELYVDAKKSDKDFLDLCKVLAMDMIITVHRDMMPLIPAIIVILQKKILKIL